MNDQVIRNAAFLISQAVCAQIECTAMAEENKVRASRGEAPAYGEVQFQELISRYGIDHNGALNTLSQ